MGKFKSTNILNSIIFIKHITLLLEYYSKVTTNTDKFPLYL